MQALYLDKNGLSLKTNLKRPAPRRGSSLVRVTLAGVCATDLELKKGYMGFNGIPGHEFVGAVEGPTSSPFLGKRVVGDINISCGKCGYCNTGFKNHCPNRSVLGILGRNGAFAEYLTLPNENLHIVPSNVTDEEAVFTEPLAAAFEITKQVKLSNNDSVAVLGDGKLGLLTALALNLTDARLTAIGKHPEKLKILNDAGIRTLTFGKRPITEKFDITVDCTGSKSGINAALSMTKPAGKVILKTTVAGERTVDLNKLVIDEITVIGSRCGPFDVALDALKKKRINVAPLIDSIYPLENGIAALKRAERKGVLKVLIRP
ncbi:MAG: alcohol dehydrogenase catalytic domain-containing protein [Deltaproteobacteria bacterium]|nr:alcohol dehydrogenase catalytic domain-containing protein [Deltaproteobacteria bacterium]